jgi:NAD(P)-dependent dehydrogenase (short-subunit alcohol dehydrogenase family)
MNTQLPLQNKTALITGGSKGIGLGIAKSMAMEKMKVAITSRHIKEAEDAAEELIKLGAPDALALQADVREFQVQQQVVAEVLIASVHWMLSLPMQESVILARSIRCHTTIGMKSLTSI